MSASNLTNLVRSHTPPSGSTGGGDRPGSSGQRITPIMSPIDEKDAQHGQPTSSSASSVSVDDGRSQYTFSRTVSRAGSMSRSGMAGTSTEKPDYSSYKLVVRLGLRHMYRTTRVPALRDALDDFISDDSIPLRGSYDSTTGRHGRSPRTRQVILVSRDWPFA